MIFIDTNVFMYAVGRSHPLREQARAFFAGWLREPADVACTSAEVQQEPVHAYLPVARLETLAAALEVMTASAERICPLESEDLVLARSLARERPSLTRPGLDSPRLLPATWHPQHQDV